MTATVGKLVFILETFSPSDLSLTRALFVLFTVFALYPILRLHQHQSTEPRQPRETAWIKSARTILKHAFHSEVLDPITWEGEGPGKPFAEDLYNNLWIIYSVFDIDLSSENSPSLIPDTPHIICTPRLDCILCPPTTQYRSLRRRLNPQRVHILDPGFRWVSTQIFVAHCQSCDADYYPDRITYKDPSGTRMQKLEYNAKYLRISKRGLWCHRNVAVAQENAVHEFCAGWANFANWVNGVVQAKPQMTNRQSQRLFIEHFSRRLLVAHNYSASFACPANLNTQEFTAHVRNVIGKDGGVVASSLHHGCVDCTHQKRYRTDLVAEGANLDGDMQDVAGGDIPPDEAENGVAEVSLALVFDVLSVADLVRVLHRIQRGELSKSLFTDCRQDYRNIHPLKKRLSQASHAVM